MDLRNEKRISTPECFVCRWAGRYVVVWPQEPLRPPEEIPPTDTSLPNRPIRETDLPQYTSGEWQAYINVHETIELRPGLKLISRHRRITACGRHWFALEHNWIYTAWQEVAWDNIFYQWLERTER